MNLEGRAKYWLAQTATVFHQWDYRLCFHIRCYSQVEYRNFLEIWEWRLGRVEFREGDFVGM